MELKLILAILVFASISFLIFGVFDSGSQKKSLRERLEKLDITSPGITLEEIEMSKSFWKRVLIPMFSKIGRLMSNYTPAGFNDRIEKRLNAAGYQKVDPLTYLGVKFIVTLSFFGLAALFAIIAGLNLGKILFYFISFPVIGFIAPDFWIQMKGKNRKSEINCELPDLLDMLTVSVEAGLGFEQAMMHSAEKMKGSISAEIKRLLQEMRIGKKRSEALRDMSDRLQISDLTSFCAAMIQADQLGVSIADVLRVQSDSMRQKRRQKAEETAMKAPLKMLFPLVFFIFPTLFIILLGPAFISIMENFRGPGG